MLRAGAGWPPAKNGYFQACLRNKMQTTIMSLSMWVMAVYFQITHIKTYKHTRTNQSASRCSSVSTQKPRSKIYESNSTRHSSPQVSQEASVNSEQQWGFNVQESATHLKHPPFFARGNFFCKNTPSQVRQPRPRGGVPAGVQGAAHPRPSGSSAAGRRPGEGGG